jgi:hypothetical protein
MPCTPFRSADGKTFGFICSRGQKQKRCLFCGAPSTKLCDHKMPSGKTCDAPVCEKCATHAHPDTDYCPSHKPGTP